MPTKKPTSKSTVKKTVRKVVKKKAAPKKAVKKTTKRTAKKTADKKPLVYADNQQSFWVSDGQILNSLVALKDALDTMDKDVYSYHAGGDTNDFALWVESVLCDADCAQSLQKAKTPKSAKTAVVKHLKVYVY